MSNVLNRLSMSVVLVRFAYTIAAICNSRLLKSHMRLKKNRPYNHWSKSQGHCLLCFSTSNGRRQYGLLAT